MINRVWLVIVESAMDEMIGTGGNGGVTSLTAVTNINERPDSRGSSNFDSTAEADNETVADDEDAGDEMDGELQHANSEQTNCTDKLVIHQYHCVLWFTL